MQQGIVRIQHPVQEIHEEAIYNLLGMHWKGIDSVCRNGRIAYSHLDWDTSRICLSENKLIAYWGVYKLIMRIGLTQVKVAGVNLPITHPDYRGVGYMSSLIMNSFQEMCNQGYGMSVINKAHNYFKQFGYVYAWPQTHFYIKSKDLPKESPTVTIRESNIYDMMGRKDLAALYNKQNIGVTGTCVRPTYLRSKHPVGDYAPGYLLENESGEMVGYIIDGPPQEPSQRYWHDDSAGDSIERLRVLGALSREYKLDGVFFDRLPFNSLLATRLRQMNCEMKVEYRCDGGYLIRIIDLATTLRAMEDELSRRIANSYLADWIGSLLIRVNDQQSILHIDQSQVRVGDYTKTHHSVEGDQHIAQLLVGTYPPLDIVRNHYLVLNGKARELIEVLFPQQHPQMPNQDL